MPGNSRVVQNVTGRSSKARIKDTRSFKIADIVRKAANSFADCVAMTFGHLMVAALQRKNYTRGFTRRRIV